MTDRIKGLTVSLTDDFREDDCEAIINAIKMIKGVGHIQTHVADPDDYFVRKRVKNEIRDKIFDIWEKL